MSRPLVNTFEAGEGLPGAIVKENETMKIIVKLQDVDDATGAILNVTDLTGAEIVACIKESYEAPEPLKLFTVDNSAPTTGQFTLTMDVGSGLIPRGLTQVAIDCAVKLAAAPNAGKRIRPFADIVPVSRGASFAP